MASVPFSRHGTSGEIVFQLKVPLWFPDYIVQLSTLKPVDTVFFVLSSGKDAFFSFFGEAVS